MINTMKDPNIAYFFRKFYRNIIKWWFVVYNPVAKRIWPSKEEEAAALANEEKNPPQKTKTNPNKSSMINNMSGMMPNTSINDSTYNATTGSYSGLYGQKPVDSDTQATLDEILAKASSQTTVDSLVTKAASTPVVLPPEHEEIIKEANEIYERLLREAAEDEAKKQAEIEAAKKLWENT